jgi:hypothetical protein
MGCCAAAGADILDLSCTLCSGDPARIERYAATHRILLFRVKLIRSSSSPGLWKALVLRDYFEVRIPYEKGDMPEPKNWRKVYLVRTPTGPHATYRSSGSR